MNSSLDGLLEKMEEKWLSDDILQFVVTWLLRNTDSPVSNQAAHIPILHSTYIQLFFTGYDSKEEDFKNPRGCQNMAHTYLRDTPKLLEKRFGFFAQNWSNNHWDGLVAINPWIKLYSDDGFHEVKRENDNGYIHGILPNAQDGAVVSKYMHFDEAQSLIWLLNIASRYWHVQTTKKRRQRTG